MTYLLEIKADVEYAHDRGIEVTYTHTVTHTHTYMYTSRTTHPRSQTYTHAFSLVSLSLSHAYTHTQVGGYDLICLTRNAGPFWEVIDEHTHELGTSACMASGWYTHTHTHTHTHAHTHAQHIYLSRMHTHTHTHAHRYDYLHSAIFNFLDVTGLDMVETGTAKNYANLLMLCITHFSYNNINRRTV